MDWLERQLKMLESARKKRKQSCVHELQVASFFFPCSSVHNVLKHNYLKTS